MSLRTIDVFDHKGHRWSLLAPPIRWNRSKTEVWLLVAGNTVPHDLRTYYEIPVPVFTEWWD